MLLCGGNNRRGRRKIGLTDFHVDDIATGSLMTARTLQNFHDLEGGNLLRPNPKTYLSVSQILSLITRRFTGSC